MSIFYMNLKKKKLRNWITDNYFEFLFSLENILKRHIDLVPAEKLKIHICYDRLIMKK